MTTLGRLPRPGLAGLSAVAILTALSGVLAWELSGADAPGAESPPMPSVVPGKARMALPPPGDAQPMMAAVLARPLFSATRRPPIPIDGPVDAPAAAPPRLSGILVSSTERRAILAPSGHGGRSVTVGEGSRFDAFVVVAITPDRVRLRNPDGAEHTVSLGVDASEREAGLAHAAAVRLAQAAPQVKPTVLDVLRLIPGEAGRLGPKAGPVPSPTR